MFVLPNCVFLCFLGTPILGNSRSLDDSIADKVVMKLKAQGLVIGSSSPSNFPSKTPRSKGACLLFGLGSQFVENKSVGGMPSFLTSKECSEAVNSLIGKHERDLVAYMTPILSEKLLPVFGDFCVLINSEEYKWLPQGLFAKKDLLAPDIFIAPHYLVTFRPPYANAPFAGENAEYGSFTDFNARRGIYALLDAKVHVSRVAIGEFEDYIRIASASEGDVREVKGMLFDAVNVYLFTGTDGMVTSITHCLWGADGSLGIICDFFQSIPDPWHIALEHFQLKTGLHVPRYGTRSRSEGAEQAEAEMQSSTSKKPAAEVTSEHDHWPSALLGAGGTGRVFRLVDSSCCVKIVCREDHTVELRNEYDNLEKVLAMSSTAPIIGCRLNSFQLHVVQGVHIAWFVMDKVGHPFKYVEDIQTTEYAGLFMSLSSLHACGIVHGDARFRNVVKYAGSYAWIDMRTQQTFTSIGIKKDLCALFKSLKMSIPAEQALDAYAERAFTNAWSSAERNSAVADLVNAM